MRALTRLFPAIIFVYVMFINSHLLHTQSPSLYGMSLDESAILVRLINLRSEGAASIRIGSVRLNAPVPGDVSPYIPVSADLYILRYQGENSEFIPRQSTIYSILALDDQLVVGVDQPHRDQLRSQIYVYTSGLHDLMNLSLRTADGSQAVIESISPNSPVQIAVNPLDIEFAFFTKQGDSQQRAITGAFNPGLSRGNSVALALVVNEDGSVHLGVHSARIESP